MLEGVKALFRFTMAILYLAFQVTPPSSCDVFTTIRNTAKDMYDIKLLLSIVEQIKLPKDSYFAIRRSFYMVQSSFNSDQFYMQSLSNDAGKQLVSNKPLSVQQPPNTKQPAMSLITAASIVAHQSINGCTSNSFEQNFNSNNNAGSCFGPRVCTSSDNSKVCIQTIGKLGRSHIKIMDANVRSNERSLMSPLRNCLVIGISNCGKVIIFARQSSRRNFKTFCEQDLLFHVHELCTEIFDGFYLEPLNLAIILTHLGEIFKIDTTRCFSDNQLGSTETLLLRDSHQSMSDYEKVKLKLASMDRLTNLLWIMVECEDVSLRSAPAAPPLAPPSSPQANRFKSSNPFLSDSDMEMLQQQDNQLSQQNQRLQNFQRKIIIIDMMTFDIFSAFSIHQNFGDIKSLRTSLVAFCQLANPMSNQFSSRIVRIGPTGHYEHLLSFSDVVDFMISVPDDSKLNEELGTKKQSSQQQNVTSSGYSMIRRFLPRSLSQSVPDTGSEQASKQNSSASPATLTRYYRSLMKSHSTTVNICEESNADKYNSMLKGGAKYSNTMPVQKSMGVKSSLVGANSTLTLPGNDKDHSSLP